MVNNPIVVVQLYKGTIFLNTVIPLVVATCYFHKAFDMALHQPKAVFLTEASSFVITAMPKGHKHFVAKQITKICIHIGSHTSALYNNNSPQLNENVITSKCMHDIKHILYKHIKGYNIYVLHVFMECINFIVSRLMHKDCGGNEVKLFTLFVGNRKLAHILTSISCSLLGKSSPGVGSDATYL